MSLGADEQFSNEALETALKQNREEPFSQEEWEGFGVKQVLKIDSFVKAGPYYFKPASLYLRVPPWDKYTVRKCARAHTQQHVNARAHTRHNTQVYGALAYTNPY